MQADCHVGLQQNFVGMTAMHAALYHSKWSALRQLYQALPTTSRLALDYNHYTYYTYHTTRTALTTLAALPGTARWPFHGHAEYDAAAGRVPAGDGRLLSS